MKVGEARDGVKGWGGWGCPDAVVLGETQLLGLHLETQGLYVDENAVSVSFHQLIPTNPPNSPPTRTLLASLSHQHFPPLSSNIHNNHLLHPPTRSHPLPFSPALQAVNLALVSPFLKPSPSSAAPPPPPSVYQSVSLSLTPSLHSHPPIISLGYMHCCSADEGEDIAASALILWKLISRTELQIPPLGTLAFERHCSV